MHNQELLHEAAQERLVAILREPLQESRSQRNPSPPPGITINVYRCTFFFLNDAPFNRVFNVLAKGRFGDVFDHTKTNNPKFEAEAGLQMQVPETDEPTKEQKERFEHYFAKSLEQSEANLQVSAERAKRSHHPQEAISTADRVIRHLDALYGSEANLQVSAERAKRSHHPQEAVSTADRVIRHLDALYGTDRTPKRA